MIVSFRCPACKTTLEVQEPVAYIPGCQCGITMSRLPNSLDEVTLKRVCADCGFVDKPELFVPSTAKHGEFVCKHAAACITRCGERLLTMDYKLARDLEAKLHCGACGGSGREQPCVCSCKTCKSEAFDPVNRPAHYADRKIEVIDFIIDSGWGEGFCLGNAVKYVARAGKKDPDKKTEDLEKARWYLDRWVQEEQKKVKEKKAK